MADTADKSAELVARLERLPFSRWHRNLFILCFVGVMFDAADFALFGGALPLVAKEFGLNQAQSGLLATVGLVGAFLGALFWGTISDYIGRRTSFQATVGSTGTTTWRPLPPVVLTKLSRPSPFSRALTSRAAEMTSPKPSPSSGSRSKTMRSALSG